MSEKASTAEPTRRDILQYSGVLGTALLGSSGIATATPGSDKQTDDILAYQPPVPARVISNPERVDSSVGLFDEPRTTTISPSGLHNVQTNSKPPIQTFQTWVKPLSESSIPTFRFLNQQDSKSGHLVKLDTEADIVELVEIDGNTEKSRVTNNNLAGSFSNEEWHRINVRTKKERIVLRVYAADETLLTESDIQTDTRPGQLANTTVTLGSKSGDAEFTEIVSSEFSTRLKQDTNRHGEVVHQEHNASTSDIDGVQATVRYGFEFEDGYTQEWTGRVLEDRSMWLKYDNDIYMTFITDRQLKQTEKKLDKISAFSTEGDNR